MHSLYRMAYDISVEQRNNIFFFVFSRIYLQNDKWHICLCGLTNSNCAIPATKTSKTTTTHQFTWSFSMENIQRRRKKKKTVTLSCRLVTNWIQISEISVRTCVQLSRSSYLLLVADRVRRIPCATDSKRKSNEKKKKLPPKSFVLLPMVRTSCWAVVCCGACDAKIKSIISKVNGALNVRHN